MSNLLNKIGTIGENPDFVAFNAHWGFAFFCMVIAAHFGVPRTVITVLALTLAAAKEFYFDMRYETSPPQTYANGLMDFAGYAAGITAGALLA